MQDYQTGGLYVAPIGGDKFSVAKVLAVDSRGLHLRIYSNVFNARPHQLNEAHLTIDGKYCARDRLSGLSHAAVFFSTIWQWRLQFIQPSTVDENELKGYRKWCLSDRQYF